MEEAVREYTLVYILYIVADSTEYSNDIYPTKLIPVCEIFTSIYTIITVIIWIITIGQAVTGDIFIIGIVHNTMYTEMGLQG